MKSRIAIVVIAGLAAGASAQVVTGYDIADAAQSGMGGWAHTYSGTITGTGSDSANGVGFDRADYTGAGSGTLNDGNLNGGAGAANLFGLTSSTSPSITVYLDGAYFVDEIVLWGNDSGNTIPGNVDGFDVTINGNTMSFTGTESNNDLSTLLAGSGLENLGTTSVTISNFVLEGQSGWTELFSIDEITVRGNPVPAPGALALLGLGGFAATRRRR
ncbi:MAG: PEP-CTERM sorting domain-containing protein [Planctomycetota bacterium]|nr:PEP-CTERM sorting domain-containing protein [Planctomycetota bacterium]